jgi:superfamily I DNA/RNA helicase
MTSPTPLRLSEQQSGAATAPDGPLLIVAGPGTGKTLTLTGRVIHLVEERGVAPERILALAFGNGAAAELRARLGHLLPSGAAVDVATFHAFGLRIVRRWASALGLPPRHVGIATPLIARRLIAEIAATLGLPGDPSILASLADDIDRQRYALAAIDSPIARALVGTYEERLRAVGLVDYPGMLAWPLRLFAQHPAALRHYQASYDHVLADEGQDICAAQAALLHALTGETGNLTVVGDPAQALYGWRGADGAFLRDFTRRYPAARVAWLTINYRSTGAIVALANRLRHGLVLGPPLVTHNQHGPPIVYHTLRDEQEEAAFVAWEARRLLAERMVAHPGEIAVLARTNAQLAALEPTLRAAGLPLAPDGERKNRLHLSTIHAAKGGEWRAVFNVGWEEGLLPDWRATEPLALAGEQNAAFVATTRPRERLYITSCAERRSAQDESPRPRAPSRYLTALHTTGERQRAA